MGCCSPFSTVTSAAVADPARHVNFTAGMVLGVDDYRQEFAYHAARNAWIVRDLLGYGTLSGLAVSLEDTPQGPRVRVTPGAAATPGGQLICVGREQCGALNAWLARAETKEELRTLTEGTADPAQTTVNLYLNLRYVDCPVADVPIPGEPCRSDENLMAPSRIADDYALSFAFDPPPMREARAGRVLDAFWASLASGGGSGIGPFTAALAKAGLQLKLALGLTPADAPAPAAGDLTPVTVEATALPRFRAAIRRLWVTKLRPDLAAQRCGAAVSGGNDCVMLARLRVPLIRPGADWQVNGTITALTLDQGDRPLLLSGAVAQTGFGGQIDTIGADTIAFMTTAGATIGAGVGVAVVISDSAIQIKLPKIDPGMFGKEVTVRAIGGGVVTLAKGAANNTIDGGDTIALPVRGCVSLIADGHKAWQVTGITQ